VPAPRVAPHQDAHDAATIEMFAPPAAG